MKKIMVLAMVALITACASNEESTMATEDTAVAEVEESSPKLRHVVMFKFKDESTDEDIQSVVDAFANLPNEIPEIKGFEWGINNSPEGLNEGLTHCFTLTFDSEEGRAVYLPHPAHKAFGEILGPHLDKVTVVDYWTQD
ncbi:Dabb family protein [Jiulongibacter sediminis]|uniref:Stress-response A/B barrel domain-containing protein n=1 Tax=Jiulongibacter sediminis TaxID=1605367 RepID=A0A0P7BMP7_9BACT|nr:Dabb family protein [Jiulongibacter sediminis]KPM46598.1 hypothetical protein AFM12_18805 [Jiulongibacter sediminis]TBX21456.1 hypothetical protein TK44_18810 [Jiulongibacter sediminis]